LSTAIDFLAKIFDTFPYPSWSVGLFLPGLVCSRLDAPMISTIQVLIVLLA
jgi:hypothetical protein